MGNTHSSYRDQLKHPLWQKKRLEIFKRDQFQCSHCHDADKTLHVHHIVYMKGRKPWEISDDDLITLCEDCHETVEAIKEVFSRLAAFSCFVKQILKAQQEWGACPFDVWSAGYYLLKNDRGRFRKIMPKVFDLYEQGRSAVR